MGLLLFFFGGGEVWESILKRMGGCVRFWLVDVGYVWDSWTYELMDRCVEGPMTKWIDGLCMFILKLVDGKQTLGWLDGWMIGWIKAIWMH